MENIEFIKEFGKVSVAFGFKRAFGGCVKNNNETIQVLDLQKSNFGNYYQLNIKIFVQGFFGKDYIIDKNLIKNSVGHIVLGETQEFKSILDLDTEMADDE